MAGLGGPAALCAATRLRPENSIGLWRTAAVHCSLVRSQPVLREAALSGAMLFGAFSSFWTTLVFFLGTPPYHYGTKRPACSDWQERRRAPYWRRAPEDRGPQRPRLHGGFGHSHDDRGVSPVDVAGHWIGGLIAGVIVMDLGMQAGHVGNLTRVSRWCRRRAAV